MIEKISMPSSIRLKYLTGVDTDGKEMFKTRTINNITPDFDSCKKHKQLETP